MNNPWDNIQCEDVYLMEEEPEMEHRHPFLVRALVFIAACALMVVARWYFNF